MFVLPLYEVLLVPGVNMYVRGEEFEEFALSKAVLHEDVVLLTAKEQKPRYAYTADDFYEIGVGGYVSDVSQDGFVTIRANERPAHRCGACERRRDDRGGDDGAHRCARCAGGGSV